MRMNIFVTDHLRFGGAQSSGIFLLRIFLKLKQTEIRNVSAGANLLHTSIWAELSFFFVLQPRVRQRFQGVAPPR